MKKTIPHKLIRFRRWTRKAYAIFNSLGRCVTIGALRSEVADASLKKPKAGIAIILRSAGRNVPCEDEPDAGLPYDYLLLQSELTGQLPLAVKTCQPEYNDIETKPNEISREDSMMTIFPAYFIQKWYTI